VCCSFAHVILAALESVLERGRVVSSASALWSSWVWLGGLLSLSGWGLEYFVTPGSVCVQTLSSELAILYFCKLNVEPSFQFAEWVTFGEMVSDKQFHLTLKVREPAACVVSSLSVSTKAGDECFWRRITVELFKGTDLAGEHLRVRAFFVEEAAERIAVC